MGNFSPFFLIHLTNTIEMKHARLSLLFILTVYLVCLISCKDSGENDEELPLMTITDSLAIEEGDEVKTIFLEVLMSIPTADTVIVFADTQEETADEDDFSPLSSYPIIFTPGDLRVSFPVEIKGDREFEQDEEFRVILKSPVGARLGTESFSIVTIRNDDIDTSLKIPEGGYTTPTEYDGYSLLWADEFNDGSLNSDHWTYEIGGGGWGNNELQYYTDQNTYMAEGNLVIESRKESFGGRAYTSSRIITMDKFEFKYGRVDIRAALPFGKGIWPALWMLGANFSEVGWPRCGEIDIMELVGGQNSDNTVHGTSHWWDDGFKADFGGSYSLNEGIFNDNFHVFSITWTENKITWYVDDVKYHEMAITNQFLTEFREPFFFIFNVAVGGNWPGSPNQDTVFPQRMIVDYIRVFKEQ